MKTTSQIHESKEISNLYTAAVLTL